MKIVVQEADFDVSEESRALCAGRTDIGAVASFVGLVRDLQQGGLQQMTLEHYPGMTEKSLQQIVAQAAQRWQVQNATIIHRVGPLTPGEQIVLVLVASAHRGDAFAACEFIMDYLKTDAPFWKKEESEEGASWVDARESDDVAKQKWQQ